MNAIIQPRLRRKHKTDAIHVIRIILQRYGITLEYVCSNTNKKDVVKYRQVIQTLLYRKTDMSLEEIGQQIGKVDHSTVCHSRAVIKRTEELNKRYGTREELFVLYGEIEDRYVRMIGM